MGILAGFRRIHLAGMGQSCDDGKHFLGQIGLYDEINRVPGAFDQGLCDGPGVHGLLAEANAANPVIKVMQCLAQAGEAEAVVVHHQAEAQQLRQVARLDISAE